MFGLSGQTLPSTLGSNAPILREQNEKTAASPAQTPSGQMAPGGKGLSVESGPLSSSPGSRCVHSCVHVCVCIVTEDACVCLCVSVSVCAHAYVCLSGYG